jgi:hypothetical protein
VGETRVGGSHPYSAHERRLHRRTSVFLDKLRGLEQGTGSRRWIYVPYDQLSRDLGPLARERASELGVVLVESVGKAERRPYHK